MTAPNDKTLLKQARRAQLERDLAAKILALPDERYGVLYVDVGWRFEPYSRETGMDRAAENHYATSTIEQIKAIDVASNGAARCLNRCFAGSARQAVAF